MSDSCVWKALVLVMIVQSSPLVAQEGIEEIRSIFDAERISQEEATDSQSYFAAVPQSDLSAEATWTTTVPSSSEYFVFRSIEIYRANDDRTGGSAVLSHVTPSGDWVTTAEYYYHPTGTLAFAYIELRTFSSANRGGLRLEHRYYFDPDGVVLRSLRDAFDLVSDERIDAPIGSFYPEPRLPIYLTLDQVLDQVPASVRK